MKQWKIEVADKTGAVWSEVIAAATFKGACAKAEKLAKANKAKVTRVALQS